MNKIKVSTFIMFIGISYLATAQIKMSNNNYIGIGISTPNYPLHVYGWAQLFNYSGMEIKFRPNNGYESDIGSNNGGIINFWNANCWANGGWNTLHLGPLFFISDQRLKKNVSNLTSNITTIKKFQPKQYNFKDSVQTSESNRLHFGFLAQDVASFLPNLVDSSRNAFLMNYIEIIPIMVGAIQEQQFTIDSLRQVLQQSSSNRTIENKNNPATIQAQIDALKNKLNYFENNCCSALSTTNSSPANYSSAFQPNISPGDTNTVYLQNIPNPFENITTIKFNIPQAYSGSFYIKVFKISGEELMSFPVQKQDKEIQINCSSFVNGVYSYALIANSDILQMKQMILSR